MNHRKPLLTFCILLMLTSLLVGCAVIPPVRTNVHTSNAPFLEDCYDRDLEGYTPRVDSHIHFRPFGGDAIAFEDMVGHLERAGVRYANVYGIGQSLPLDSACTYYLDCPGVPVRPSIRNDFLNALNLVVSKPTGVHLTLSMTFPDLAEPDAIIEGMRVLDREFPGLFGWMGEVNLVKQALFANGHEPVPLDIIRDWAPLMKHLRERDMPLAIHADLGNDDEPLKYREWMQTVLQLYPDNRIIWMHMGLSKELMHIDPHEHIRLMQTWLDSYPLLMMDLSWSVVDQAAFSTEAQRDIYLPFIHQYSHRFLPGSDFVASAGRGYEHYWAELEATSRILGYLDDSAFRNIALGKNYFQLLGLEVSVPEVCTASAFMTGS